MKTTRLASALALAIGLISVSATAEPWTYRGSLYTMGKAAHGSFGLRLTLFDAASGGRVVGAPITLSEVAVDNGNFSADIDLDAIALSHEKLWIGVEVRDESGSFAALAERSAFEPNGSALTCWDTAGNTGTDPASQFLGTVDAQALVLRTGNTQSLRLEPSSVLFAGLPNTANVIAGSVANNVTFGVRGATIGGGGLPIGNSDPDFVSEGPNQVTDSFGTIAGGFGNRAGNAAGTTIDTVFATVGGGVNNTAGGFLSSVMGGEGNNSLATYSTIAGGQFNAVPASATWGAIGGGGSNVASGSGSAISGGLLNTASGSNSSIAGGSSNCAGGSSSFAGGLGAKVRPGSGSGIPGDGCNGVASSGDFDGDNGTFVWADSINAAFTSSGPNQFLIRAAGGAGINVIPAQMNSPGPRAGLLVGPLVAGGSSIIFNPASGASLTTNQGGSLELGAGDNTSAPTGATPFIDFHIGNASVQDFNVRLANIVSNTLMLSAGAGAGTVQFNVDGNAAKTGGGSWGVFSDARLKQHVRPIESPLSQLLALEGHEYEYIAGKYADAAPGTQRGFVAQEVEKLFPDWVSETADGYKMVSVKGFEALTVEAMRELKAEHDVRLDEAQAQIAELKSENAALASRLSALEHAQLRRTDTDAQR